MTQLYGGVLGGIPRKGWGKSLKGVFEYLDFRTPAGVTKLGSAPTISGMSCYEGGAHAFRQTKFSFSSCAFALTDVASTVAYSGKKIYAFPAGNILILGATANLTLGKSSAGVNATWNGDFSLGTVTASNNATLSSTEANIIPSTATPAAVAGATTAKGINTAAIAPLDGTGTAVDLYLNFLVDDADQDVTTTPCNLLVSGDLYVTWVPLGDF